MTATKIAHPKVVLDTNTILSALLFNQTKLSQLRIIWQSGQIIPLASKQTISELIRVLTYPKFKLTNSQKQEFLAEYLPFVQTIAKVQKIVDASICRDADDIMFLELAMTGNVEYLVTGDKDILVLQQIFPFQIITPAELIQKVI